MIKIIESKERLNNPLGLIVPFSVYGKEDGGFDFEVFDCVQDLLKDEMKNDISDFLTEGFYERINGKLADAVGSLGYTPDYYLTHSFIFNFERTTRTGMESDAVCITDLTGYLDVTESDFDTNDFPVFAITDGCNILSVCGVNGLTGKGRAEIAVATCETRRRRGYALACLTAMTDYLVERGYAVSYVCESGNTASVALAERAGFTLISREYNFVSFEKEE